MVSTRKNESFEPPARGIVVNKKQFAKGAFLTVTFFSVLALMFSPLFHGENAFQAADRLFNSIAKGSSNFFDEVKEGAQAFQGNSFQAALDLKSEEMAVKTETLLRSAGAQAVRAGSTLEVSGDLGQVAMAALEDAEAMFHNKGEEISAKYGLPAKEVLFAWWSTFKDAEKSFKSQEKFKEAAFLEELNSKAVEVGYNFFGIEPWKASANAGVLGFALLFYVLYTLWWGYAILFLFDGVGLEMKAGAKKEL
ncbi:MAG: hypothetical protein AB1640_14835 [bacterium]